MSGGLIKTEGECGTPAKRDCRREQFQFLGRHFGETVEPQAFNFEFRVLNFKFGLKRPGCGVEQMVAVLQFMPRKPGCISVQQQREVIEFVTQFVAGAPVL